LKKGEKPINTASPIPEFNLIEFQKNQNGFLKNLDPLVALIEAIHALMHMHDVKNSLIFLFYVSFMILFYEWALSIIPFSLILIMLYNKHKKSEFKRYEVNYLKNIRCV